MKYRLFQLPIMDCRNIGLSTQIIVRMIENHLTWFYPLSMNEFGLCVNVHTLIVICNCNFFIKMHFIGRPTSLRAL